MKEKLEMLDNQFQFALMATEDRIRELRARGGKAHHSTQRIFRLSGERQPAREAGRR